MAFSRTYVLAAAAHYPFPVAKPDKHPDPKFNSWAHKDNHDPSKYKQYGDLSWTTDDEVHYFKNSFLENIRNTLKSKQTVRTCVPTQLRAGVPARAASASRLPV